MQTRLKFRNSCTLKPHYNTDFGVHKYMQLIVCTEYVNEVGQKVEFKILASASPYMASPYIEFLFWDRGTAQTSEAQLNQKVASDTIWQILIYYNGGNKTTCVCSTKPEDCTINLKEIEFY